MSNKSKPETKFCLYPRVPGLTRLNELASDYRHGNRSMKRTAAMRLRRCNRQLTKYGPTRKWRRTSKRKVKVSR